MKKTNTRKGVSLIEITLVIAISSMLVLAIGSFQRNIFFFAGFLEDSISGAQDARSVLRTMAREIRSASPSSLGTYTISEASPQTFIFYSDIDDDGLKERVRYFLDDTDLKKGVIKPSGNPMVYDPGTEKIVSLLVRNVRNGAQNVFDYYDTNYDGTTDSLPTPADIIAVRLVKITVIIDADVNRAPVAKTFESQVSLRNLKDNL
jgi:type II secretory pathway pseudopilin PulG